MDLSIGEIVLWAIAFWILSQVLLGIVDGWRLVELRERLGVLKQLNDIIHQVKVEKHNDVEYWFDRDSEEFLGQGKTIEEVIAHLKARFPDHIFLLQGVGGVAKQTDWKLLDVEEFQKVQLTIKDI
jgi:hypothetical protein